MAFSDTEMKELGKSTQINIHNTRSLIRALKYVSDILQTEEAFTVEKHTHTHTHTHTRVHAHYHQVKSVHKGVHVFQISQKGPYSIIAENVM